MRYFANPTGSKSVHAAIAEDRLGYIDTPAQGNIRPSGVSWCADNGRFGRGWPGFDAWLSWLASHRGAAPQCTFATAPDVVGNAAATLAESRPWLPEIRALGFPAALVAQDGLEVLTPPWSDFDVLFIGGTTEWKLGPEARSVAEAALARGKRVHMGRVNSLRRLRYAKSIGCHSADGTYLTFGPDKNLPKLLHWLDLVNGVSA